jgi:hypothetical protein
MELHKTQVTALTQMLQDGQTQLDAGKKRELALTAAVDEQKRKVLVLVNTVVLCLHACCYTGSWWMFRASSVCVCVCVWLLSLFEHASQLPS